jgi:hypothetical protein
MSIYYSKCTSTPFSIISLLTLFIFHLSPWLYQLVVIPSDPSQIFFIAKYSINFLRLGVVKIVPSALTHNCSQSPSCAPAHLLDLGHTLMCVVTPK